jgi:hypothetical protein
MNVKKGCQIIKGDINSGFKPLPPGTAGVKSMLKGFIKYRIIVKTIEINNDTITERMNTKSSLIWFLILKKLIIIELNNIQVIIDPS